MGGERTNALEAVHDGIAQDRRYAFLSSGAPVGKPRLTSREREALLRYSARASGKETDVLTPEGRTYGVDDPALILDLEQ
ncbi:MAG: hypothetical protein INR71_11810, partial [Terriglobus roseus]|nr:hypothetical protein [Terriglobus roseus]